MYEVNRTDNSKIPITVDTSKVKTQIGLTWVGQYYSRYGETLHENFLRLAENFAGPDTPGIIDDSGLQYNHVLGQLWYHTDDVDHKNSRILNVFNNNGNSNTNGFKRIEWIISESMPSDHTEGEVWYHATDRFLSVSRGNNWEEVTVKLAMDSDLLDGLDSTQFLRSDVDDIMEGELETRGVFPGHDLSHNLGKPTKRWNIIYGGTLNTDNSVDFIPKQTNTYVLGNNQKRWKELNSVLVNSEYFSDVNPETDNTHTLGTDIHRWEQTHTNYLYVDQSSTIIPIDTSQNLGSNTRRWNNAKINELDTVSSRDLIPTNDSQYNLGSSSNQWNRLYVDKINTAKTHHFYPESDNMYDLGNNDRHYRNIYVKNIVGETTIDGEIKFNIIQNNDSHGITWEGLGDAHRIYVEEYANDDDSRLVIESGSNANDYLVVKHNNDHKLSVKTDIVDATAGTLRTKGSMKVEHENTSNGVEMEYNQNNHALEFRFY